MGCVVSIPGGLLFGTVAIGLGEKKIGRNGSPYGAIGTDMAVDSF